MSREPITQDQLHEILEDPHKHAALRAKRKHDAATVLESLVKIEKLMGPMVDQLKEFEKERDRLGEYDASAAAIISLARTVRTLAELMHAHANATLHLELDK